MSFAGLLFSLANVRCEQCQKKFRLKDLKDNEFLVCEACGIAKPIVQRGDAPAIDYDKSLIKPTPAVNIERKGSIFILEKRWLSRHSKFVLFLAFVWNAAWISSLWAIRHGYLPADTFQMDPLQKNLVILSGLILLMWALRSSLNRTRIMIKNKKMVVSTSPIHFGNLAIYDITQISGMKLWQQNKKTGQPSFNFRVDMTLKDGRTVTLCPAQDSNEAAYIEKTLEEFLAIELTPIVADPLVS